MKRFFLWFLIFSLLCNLPAAMHVKAENRQPLPSLSAPSVLLMEAETGTVLYKQEELKQRPPASITKIMTLDLIFEALDKGQIQLSDEVSVSEHAASMGGSQVFLEPGETQTVETMIKCISIASANDACVAMAEYLSGSEESFVASMNEKAKQLGMDQTHFINCCGLDTDGHLTCAYDIALMSRDLIINHPQIHDYCTIWMDTMVHATRKGSSEFGLTNPNKLTRQYPYATGLKTGSTGLAKYCLSATAKKDGVSLIAVIMAAPDPKSRFSDAKSLLDYGFANCRIYRDEKPPALPLLPVRHGSLSDVGLNYGKKMLYVDTEGNDLSKIERKLSLPKSVEAPIKKGKAAGTMNYYLNGKKIGSVPVTYAKSVKRAGILDYFRKLAKQMFLIMN